MTSFGNEKMENMFRGTVKRGGEKDPLFTAVYGETHANSLDTETGGLNNE